LKETKDLEAQAKSLSSQAEKLGKEATQDAAALAKTEADIRGVEARLAKPISDTKRQQLEAQLADLQKTEQQQQAALSAVQKQQQQVRDELQQLLKQSQQVATKQKELAEDTVSLADQAAELAKQANAIVLRKEDLIQEAADIQVSAAQTQTEAANLNTQKVQLQEQQKQAKQQQQQAEQLDNQLTEELTKAGGDERGTDPRLVKLQDGLENTKGVQVVSPPHINKSGNAVVFTAIPTTDPAAPATADLVKELRNYVIPRAISGTDLRAYVGGSTAGNVDLAAGISSRLLLVIMAVVLLSFIILLTAYRSLIVGAQAALVNVLSVSAAFGVLTACFQWGWGLGIIGLDAPSGTDPIASFVPLMMFAVLFGALDGLPGVPAQPGGAPSRPGRGSSRVGRERPRDECEGDRRGRADHDLGLRQLRHQRRSNRQAVRRRPGSRSRAGGDERPAALTGAARARLEGELVGAPLAGQDPPAPRHRG
jgi:chemotaxis protein histidine kinase CheA